jgi:hypothetical protein
MVCPARPIWGPQAHQRLSPELESSVAYTASETASCEAAAKMARIWGSPVRASVQVAVRFAVFFCRHRQGNLGPAQSLNGLAVFQAVG